LQKTSEQQKAKRRAARLFLKSFFYSTIIKKLKQKGDSAGNRLFHCHSLFIVHRYF